MYGFAGLLRKMPWLRAAVLFVAVATAGAVMAQGPVNVLRLRTQNCANMQALDFLNLQQLTGEDGGKVTVRAFIDQNGHINTRILQSAERSGPDSLWDHVAAIIRTWCFPQGAISGGHLDYTVVVNSRSNGGGGFVEINAKDLILADGWTLDPSHGQTLAHVQNIDLGDVMITECPPSLHVAGTARGWGAFKSVIGHLGAGFQVIFAVLLLFLVVAEGVVGVRGARSWVKPPFTLGRGKGSKKTDQASQPQEDVGVDPEELRVNFGSFDALEIRRLWIQAMEMAQLEPASLPKVDSETVKKLEALKDFTLNRAKSGDDIYDKARNLGLVGRGRIFQTADFTLEATVKETMSLDDLKRAAMECAKRDLDADIFLQVGQAIQKATNEEELEKILREHNLSLGEVPESGPEGDYRDLESLRKMVSERLDWAKLYLQYLEKGFTSSGPGGEERLRTLTWDHFARQLVERAHKRASTLARQRIDLFEVFEAGLSNHLVNRNEWWSSQEIDRSVDRSLSVKLDERKSVLDSLWAIGAIAPLIGLFGTVWGISAAFGKIQNIQEAQLRMAKLSGDINVALATTIVGLIIGIIAFLSYYWFKGRIESKGAEVAKYFTDITNRA